MPVTDSKPTSDNPQTKAPQNVQYAAPYPQQFEDDTIDLYELWITLWNKKWIVIAVTVIAALGSVVYALQQTPIFKAEALLLPPKAKDVQSLNLKQNLREARQVGEIFTPLPIRREVFTTFENNLHSRILQKKFIEEYGLLDILAPNRTPETMDIEILEGFSKMIKIESIEEVPLTEGFLVTMESNDPKIAAEWVNSYIKFIDTETIRTLVVNMQNSIAVQVRDIEYKIDSKRKMAKRRREDQISRFEEAAVIARSLGVRDRIDVTNVVQNNQMNSSTSSNPLYYRGFRALSSESETLKNRKSDDPFIEGLRDLQESLDTLRSIKIEDEGMHAVSIDQAAYPPKNRIKPDRRLIVSLSTVVGLFLGIFLVFFVSFVQKERETHSE
jgi:chain length determinant protein (polysaccharide antigen chain regulator)